MKTFKTFFFTTLFWWISLFGIWVASFFFPELLTDIIPQPVKTAIVLEHKDREDSVQMRNTEEPALNTEPQNQQVSTGENSDFVPSHETSLSGTLLNTSEHQAQLETEVTNLQNRVALLENNLGQVIAFLQSVTVVNPEAAHQDSSVAQQAPAQPEATPTVNETPAGVVNTFGTLQR